MAYRILYVGNFTVEDSPLGFSPNAEWISKTFEELGHTVTRMDEAQTHAEQVAIELDKGYDILLTEEARLHGDFLHDESKDVDILKGLFKPVMRRAKSRGVPVVAWLTNIFMSIGRREIQVTTNPIFKADIVFSTDGGHQKEFEKAGVNHHLLRQGIYEPEAYMTDEKYPTTAEIGFIGAIYENIWPYRKELVEWLTAIYGHRFMHVGTRGEVRHDALNRLCGTLKIVVGDSVASPQYWSNRLYEIIGRGGFLIFPKIEGLDKELIPYKHYIPYKMGNFTQLREIINYYLTHDKEREAIRKAGFEYCKKHHTYQIRVKEMLRILEEQKII